MNIKKYLIYSSILSLFSEALVITWGVDLKLFYVVIFINSYILLKRQSYKASKKILTIFSYLTVVALVNIFQGYNSLSLFLMQLIGIAFVSLYYYNFILFVGDFRMLMNIYIKVSYYIALIGLALFLFQLLYYGSVRRLESVMNEPAHYVVLIMPAFYILFWRYVKFKENKKEMYVLLFSIFFAASSVGFIGLVLVYVLGRKITLSSIVKTIFVPSIFMVLLYNYNEHVRLRVFDTFKTLTTLSVEGTNLSTYALVSNVYIASRNFFDHTLMGSGLGSYRMVHELYVNDIEGIESLTQWGNGYEEMNKNDAGSLFLRILAEHGLIGIILLFIFLNKNRKKLDAERKLISNALLVLILLKLFREVHYFSPDIWFFLTMFYFLRFYNLEHINTQSTEYYL